MKMAGWNGEGSVSPSKELVELCMGICVHLVHDIGFGESSVHPVEDGGIDLVWESLGIYCIFLPEHTKSLGKENW